METKDDPKSVRQSRALFPKPAGQVLGILCGFIYHEESGLRAMAL
jgi:hypothetical protein